MGVYEMCVTSLGTWTMEYGFDYWIVWHTIPSICWQCVELMLFQQFFVNKCELVSTVHTPVYLCKFYLCVFMCMLIYVITCKCTYAFISYMWMYMFMCVLRCQGCKLVSCMHVNIVRACILNMCICLCLWICECCKFTYLWVHVYL